MFEHSEAFCWAGKKGHRIRKVCNDLEGRKCLNTVKIFVEAQLNTHQTF